METKITVLGDIMWPYLIRAKTRIHLISIRSLLLKDMLSLSDYVIGNLKRQ